MVSFDSIYEILKQITEKMEKEINSPTSEDERFCFEILQHVSRNYAMAINLLEQPLRTTVCVFYLILRALDTVEDDTTVNKSMKLESLKTFSTYLDENANGVRFSCQNDNKCIVELLAKFDKVLRTFGKCTSAERKIIRDVTEEMAIGMIKYTNRSIDTLVEYNEYCYYVSGLVGVGLTKLIRSDCVLDDHLQRLSISTGKFVQKANILRDIYEDLNEPTPRIFCPEEVWRKYVKNAVDLIDEKFLPQAIECLNYLINDAFQHLPDLIEYLSLIPQNTTFRFIAIPQVMAVGTLEKIFNNPAVFSSLVQLPKSEAIYIFENVNDFVCRS